MYGSMYMAVGEGWYFSAVFSISPMQCSTCELT